MSEIQITSEILTLVITALASLGSTLPFIARFKSKLAQTRALIIAIESALEDERVTKSELKIIGRYASELIGKGSARNQKIQRVIPGD